MNSVAKRITKDSSEKMTVQDFIAICQLDDLQENLGFCALVKGRQVALFRISGIDKVFAIDNHDPFSEANVLSRGVVGDLKGRLVVASPIYKQHFDLETGQCLEDESVVLDTFEVRVVDGVVKISC